MGSFAFKLEHKDGTPAEPPVLHTAVSNWALATRSRWGPRRAPSEWLPIRASADGEPVLVVESD